MAKYSKADRPSKETQEEAQKIAKGTQRPGQTKEQTRLIAQGIQKGIDQYKRQQKAKARELNKALKKAKNGQPTPDSNEPEIEILIQHSKWPWVLLALSWVGFLLYALLLNPA